MRGLPQVAALSGVRGGHGLREGSARRRLPEVQAAQGRSGFLPLLHRKRLRYMGAGSERLSEQLAKAFPRATVRRADPTTVEASSGHADFADADIYVTTWIGTKAALRPEVSVVGILDADALIRRPDFRAAETAYQAFAEMSEWAGPASAGGKLIIQTAEPEHHAVQAVVRGDYGYFLERELATRRELGYPPFSELIKVWASGPSGVALLERAVAAAISCGAVVLGPIPARRSGVDGTEILIKAADAGLVAAELRVILPEVPSGSRLRVDVDPR